MVKGNKNIMQHAGPHKGRAYRSIAYEVDRKLNIEAQQVTFGYEVNV